MAVDSQVDPVTIEAAQFHAFHAQGCRRHRLAEGHRQQAHPLVTDGLYILHRYQPALPDDAHAVTHPLHLRLDVGGEKLFLVDDQ